MIILDNIFFLYPKTEDSEKFVAKQNIFISDNSIQRDTFVKFVVGDDVFTIGIIDSLSIRLLENGGTVCV